MSLISSPFFKELTDPKWLTSENCIKNLSYSPMTQASCAQAPVPLPSLTSMDRKDNYSIEAIPLKNWPKIPAIWKYAIFKYMETCLVKQN